MPFIQRYSDVKKGGITFLGNTLGLSKAPNQNAPGTEGSIGAFTSLDLTLQVGTFPAGTTLDYANNGSRTNLTLLAGSTVLYAEHTCYKTNTIRAFGNPKALKFHSK